MNVKEVRKKLEGSIVALVKQDSGYHNVIILIPDHIIDKGIEIIKICLENGSIDYVDNGVINKVSYELSVDITEEARHYRSITI